MGICLGKLVKREEEVLDCWDYLEESVFLLEAPKALRLGSC